MGLFLLANLNAENAKHLNQECHHLNRKLLQAFLANQVIGIVRNAMKQILGRVMPVENVAHLVPKTRAEVFEREQLKKENEAIKRELRELKDSEGKTVMGTTECVVCMDKEPKIALIPCGHMCTCKDCTDVLTTRSSRWKPMECPICRAPITATQVIFQ